MRNALRIKCVVIAAAAAVTAVAGGAQAAVVYDGGVTTNSYTVIQNFTANAAGNLGYGDDYNTGRTGNIQLNGFSFIGGTQGTVVAGTTTPAASTAMLFIDFYNTSGVEVATITPDPSEVAGFGTHTLAASDFGAAGVTVPAAGYVIFSPFTYSTDQPRFSLAGGGAAPTVGTNDSTLSAAVMPDANGNRVFSTGTYVPAGFGPSPQRVTFSLSATPEPAALSLLVPAVLCGIRRRRSANA